MAEFDFFEPVNMRGNGSAPSYGYVTEASSGWINITGSYWEDDYFGYGFTYSGNTVTGGVLTDYYGTVYGLMVMAINGMHVSAAAVAQYITAGDLFTAMSIMASGNDVITCWGDGADVVYAWGGNDFLYGMTGNDYLNGGTGADTMIGGLGNDIFIVDHAGDKVFEAAGQGTDTVYTSVSFALAAGQHIETLATTSQAGTGAINLTGNELAQTINGNNGANVINGGGGNDIINGFGGNDVIYGGAGNDTLTGGAGNDYFVFNTALNASTNVDTDHRLQRRAGHDPARQRRDARPRLHLGTLYAADVLEKHDRPRPRQQRPHHLRDRHRLAELRQQRQRRGRCRPYRPAGPEPRAHPCGFLSSLLNSSTYCRQADRPTAGVGS